MKFKQLNHKRVWSNLADLELMDLCDEFERIIQEDMKHMREQTPRKVTKRIFPIIKPKKPKF